MSQVSAFEFAKSSGNDSTTLEPRHGAKFLFTKVSIDSDRQERAIREVQELNSPTSFKVVIGSFLETLFREVSDRYHPLDEDIFRDSLKSWNSLSFFMLEKAALGLSEDVKFLPVLFLSVFQYQSPIFTTGVQSYLGIPQTSHRHVI
ncbi:hypothetical protein BELL_0053g00220 [Botrytis elliptica]|uniref:Uncharacterized protein n=1 Tax=Botrytis elliptica TaxID=278938 RepID=A0A4Z1JZN1_9HELO|nr:hypothetical protein BELL_0053g00220 [Botrytis elliptica]